MATNWDKTDSEGSPTNRHTFTDEEKQVLMECRRNSMFRGAVTGGISLFIATKSTQNRFARVAVTLVGGVCGIASYAPSCRNKILALDHSPLAEHFKKNLGINQEIVTRQRSGNPMTQEEIAQKRGEAAKAARELADYAIGSASKGEHAESFDTEQSESSTGFSSLDPPPYAKTYNVDQPGFVPSYGKSRTVFEEPQQNSSRSPAPEPEAAEPQFKQGSWEEIRMKNRSVPQPTAQQQQRVQQRETENAPQQEFQGSDYSLESSTQSTRYSSDNSGVPIVGRPQEESAPNKTYAQATRRKNQYGDEME